MFRAMVTVSFRFEVLVLGFIRFMDTERMGLGLITESDMTTSPHGFSNTAVFGDVIHTSDLGYQPSKKPIVCFAFKI